MIFHMWVGYEERKTPIDFEVNRSKVNVVETGNRNILSAQYLENLLFRLLYFICGLVMRRGQPQLILRSIGQRSFKLEIGIFCPLS